jgi:L-rhamnose mutarotase
MEVRMIRVALHARLKPGAGPEYKRLHDEVPTAFPELADAIREAGIDREVVFTAGTMLVVYAEVSDPDAYPRLFAMPVHDRWAELLAPLMEPREDGLPDVQHMDNIWELDLTVTPAVVR